MTERRRFGGESGGLLGRKGELDELPAFALGVAKVDEEAVSGVFRFE